MSSVRDRVRGRWAWKFAALVAAATLVAAPAAAAFSPPPAMMTSPGAARLPAKIAEKKVKKKQVGKKHRKEPASITGMIKDEFGHRADEALRIAHCESRFDTDDVSSAGAVGVFQIRPVDHGWRIRKVKKGKDLTDAATNVAVALHIFKDQGWRPWVCARTLGFVGGSSSAHHIATTSSSRNNEGSRSPRVPRSSQRGNMS